LTEGEVDLVRFVFGTSIDPGQVRLHRRKWFFLQPQNTVMAPSGHIHFHPRSALYRDDFSREDLTLQGLFIHEMVHVWQAQTRGRLYLPLMRHPFCRYRYRLEPGKPFLAYGLEQQAEIVRHAFLARSGACSPELPPLDRLLEILPFQPDSMGPTSSIA